MRKKSPLWSFFKTLPLLGFIAILLSIPTGIAAGAYITITNTLASQKFVQIESAQFNQNPRSTVKISKKTEGLILNHKKPGDPEEAIAKLFFKIDPSQKENLISKQYYEALGFNLMDIIFTPGKSEEGRWSINRNLIIPNLFFEGNQSQKSKNKKLEISNLKFKLDLSENVLGRDFLDLFDYKLSDNQLSLKLHYEEQLIWSEKKDSEALQSLKSHIARSIREDWQEHLANRKPDFWNPKNRSLKNEVEISIETFRGNLTGVKFLSPSDDAEFNSICQNFLMSLERFKSIPKELKENPKLKLRQVLSI